ncbi:integrator complex subunit 13-like [Haliotis cracherodii]|uniref:integrator complex subunit 13-like n=1 Tax=Haliotis cracherodii TaxID=6455 RepID=UPI0039E8B4B3
MAMSDCMSDQVFANSLKSSHKTLFVLDRHPYFSKSSKQPIEYDVITRSKTPGIIPAAPITKTLWTCSVECMMEYMRIVFDIYPVRKLIRIVTGNHSLNSWSQKEQNLQQLMIALAHLGPPTSRNKSEDEYSVMHGLARAVEVMCEPSEAQSDQVENGEVVHNHGRIICLTSFKSDAHVRMLEECVLDAITQHNKLQADQEGLIPIDHMELVLLHITAVGDEAKLSERPKREVSSILASEVLISQSGKFLYNKLVSLVQRHYNLGSTTVTGIPMKEEQNASSSANYDVELLHPASVHEEIFKTVSHVEGLVIPSKEGLPTETVTLKWCTPKSNTIELHHCVGAHRITPVDVNSRPSSCLTNFLLGGRAVMLEQPRKTGAKVISHMLTSHGGEIFIHTIPTARSILEDPPSISEGSGGRVTDYRIPDFGEFMKSNRLAPGTAITLEDRIGKPIERAQQHLERLTRVWPMVIGETIMFNMVSSLEPLLGLITQATLNDDDVLECKKAIYKVVAMESKNEALPFPVLGSRGKGPKREEQYRQLWAELEMLVRAHVLTSPFHEKVLECLLECKKPSDDAKGSPKKALEKSASKDEKMEVSEQEDSWKDYDKMKRMTEREKQDFLKGEKSLDPSPPKKFKAEESFIRSGGQNLLSMWTNRIKTIHNKRHVEFAGREDCTGAVAELYIHLNDDDEQPPMEQTSQASKTAPTSKPLQSLKR